MRRAKTRPERELAQRPRRRKKETEEEETRVTTVAVVAVQMQPMGGRGRGPRTGTPTVSRWRKDARGGENECHIGYSTICRRDWKWLDKRKEGRRSMGPLIFLRDSQGRPTRAYVKHIESIHSTPRLPAMRDGRDVSPNYGASKERSRASLIL